MRAAPNVLEGLRAGRDTPGRVTPGVDRSDPGLYARISALLRGKNLVVDRGEKTPWDVVFMSKNSHHMVQVTAPEDVVDPRNGRKIRARPIMVVFNNCLYSVPRVKYRDPVVAQGIVDWLRGHPNFKLDFWEQKDLANEALIRKTVHVIESISGDKAVREVALEYLTQNDFVDDETKVTGLGSTVIDEGPDGEDPGDPEDEEDETDLGGEAEVEEPEPEVQAAPAPEPDKPKRGRPKGSVNKKRKFRK
jgi:hypothetical protein